MQPPMAQGRSTNIVSMIKWIRTSRLLKDGKVNHGRRHRVDACEGGEEEGSAAAERGGVNLKSFVLNMAQDKALTGLTVPVR